MASNRDHKIHRFRLRVWVDQQFTYHLQSLKSWPRIVQLHCLLMIYLFLELALLTRGEHPLWLHMSGQSFQTLTLFKTKSIHFATLFKTRDCFS